MKGKMNRIKKVPLSLLLVSSIILSNGSYLVKATNNAPIEYNEEISDLTDQQLAALTNPVLQQYNADESHKIWKMTTDTRFVILADQKILIMKD